LQSGRKSLSWCVFILDVDYFDAADFCPIHPQSEGGVPRCDSRERECERSYTGSRRNLRSERHRVRQEALPQAPSPPARPANQPSVASAFQLLFVPKVASLSPDSHRAREPISLKMRVPKERMIEYCCIKSNS